MFLYFGYMHLYFAYVLVLCTCTCTLTRTTWSCAKPEGPRWHCLPWPVLHWWCCNTPALHCTWWSFFFNLRGFVKWNFTICLSTELSLGSLTLWHEDIPCDHQSERADRRRNHQHKEKSHHQRKAQKLFHLLVNCKPRLISWNFYELKSFSGGETWQSTKIFDGRN